MTPTETVSRLRRLADDWRKEEKQLCEQFGSEIVPRSLRARRTKDTKAIEMIECAEEDVPAVMLAAADEIDRLQSVIAGLRADFETAHARMMTSAEREREACAALCDRFALRDMHPAECAAAIRARGGA